MKMPYSDRNDDKLVTNAFKCTSENINGNRNVTARNPLKSLRYSDFPQTLFINGFSY